MRRKAILIGTFVALLAMALPGSALAGKGHKGACSDGTLYGGTYKNVTVRGTCVIDGGANVHITGNLTIAKGASLNDHGAEGWKGAQMHIDGNVKVGKGAVLGLGYNAYPGTLGPDTVGGNIIANHPMALQLGSVTVGGNVISKGGRGPGRNFPIKDNVIHGNLTIEGWHGGWIGLIRNTVDGNVKFSKNKADDTSEEPGSDSSEVQTNWIGGKLSCHGNDPAAQVNPGDGGELNVVGGKAKGECAGLTY